VFARDGERMLPLYEGKMVDAYDHRASDVVRSATAAKRQNQPKYISQAEHEDPTRCAQPGVWVNNQELPELSDQWLFGFARITSPTNERTMLAAAIPLSAVGDSFFLAHASEAKHLLLSVLNSFPLDYVARQKVAGLNLNFFYVYQLPIPERSNFSERIPWSASGEESWHQWISPRVIELSYTAWDMEHFAHDLGDDGPPFIWDDERRAQLRAELDACYFHLYGVERDDVDYILDTFPIVKRKDEQHFGEYRTKRLILEAYDAMSTAIATGGSYQTILDPPPGRGPRHSARSN